MTHFFRFFAERNLLAYLLTLIVILLGLGMASTMKRDLFPKVDFGEMLISTRYPGASPEDVELKVTNAIEEELKEVVGIQRYVSFSMENISIINVRIDPDESDQDRVKQDIRDAVNRVTDLPQDVTESPLITELNTSIFPVIEVGLSGNLPYPELRELARRFEKKLKALPGVSRIERFGYLDREIKIEVRPDAIKSYEIPMRHIINAIKARNIRATGGSFESYTSEKNIVTLAQFRDPLEVGDVIVRSTFDGPQIRVKDLALVRDGFEEERIQSRMNGHSAISLVAYKTEAADIIRLVSSVKDLVKQEKALFPKGVDVLFSRDSSRYVSTRFATVVNNGALGLVLVVGVLTAFLNLRAACWVALGIPVSLLGVVALLPLFDVYLDSITLTAMILVVGIIVDDAIIVSESIYRKAETGLSAMRAAVEGIQEVFQPVLTTILTTFLAFAPLFAMPGMMGKFVFVIPLTITLALLISMGEVILLPAHLVPGLRRYGQSRRVERTWFERVRVIYEKFVRTSVRYRYVSVAAFIALLAGSIFYAVTFMDFVLFPSTAADRVYIAAELPIGASLDATSDKVKGIERLIEDLGPQEVSSYITRIGDAGDGIIALERENSALLTLSLTPFNKRERTADQIVEDLRRRTKRLQGFERIRFQIDAGGPPVGRPITIRVVGSDDTQRTQLAQQVETFIKDLKGTKDIERDDKPGKQQIEIQIDYSALAKLKLTVADVAQTVRIAYDGEVVTNVRYGEEDVDFRVQLLPTARQDERFLQELIVPNQDGQLISLKRVARFVSGSGPSNYHHFDGERSITITGDVNKEITTPLKVTEAVSKQFDLERDYPGMRMVYGGEAEETQQSVDALWIIFAVALIGIYFLLILLFNSIAQPFLVMLAIPFGLIGVIVAFTLHGEALGFLAMMGIIGLIGVVVNDSLVLVDHINHLRKLDPARPLFALIAQGSSDRLRAVVMTSLTTVAGLLPIGYGIGGSDPYMSPMALALGYGILFATPLTLILLPCLYMIGDDFNRILSWHQSKPKQT